MKFCVPQNLLFNKRIAEQFNHNFAFCILHLKKEVTLVADYKKMYMAMLDGAEKAIQKLQSLETDGALKELIDAQLRAEEIYIKTDNNDEH